MRTSALAARHGLRAVVFACCTFVFSPSTAYSHDSNTGESSQYTRFGEGWPPQPRGIGDVVWEQSGAALRAAPAGPDVETLAREHATNARLLGRRYTYISTETLPSDAAIAPARSLVTYFSHSRNRTVQLTLAPGGAVESVKQLRPENFQPEITDDESAQAIALARAQLVASGHQRAGALAGYGILAHPPSGTSAFYANRVIYVSFHEHDDARPEFVALVDLSNRRVLQSRRD